MEKRMMYDQIMFICYILKGKNFYERSAKRHEEINEFLREFRRKIEDLRIKEGTFSACPERVDEFSSELLDGSTLICSHQIKFSCVDADPGYAQFQNIQMRPLLHKTLRALSLFNGEKYNERLEIRVVDTIFQGEKKSGKWPKESMTTINF